MRGVYPHVTAVTNRGSSVALYTLDAHAQTPARNVNDDRTEPS